MRRRKPARTIEAHVRNVWRRSVGRGCVVVALLLAVWLKRRVVETQPDPDTMAAATPSDQDPGPPKSAVVLGATGATGRPLVEALLRSNRFSRVTTIGRSKHGGVDGVPDSKLTEHTIDPITAIGSRPELWRGHDVAFCVLGTTRSKAGGATEFVQVDRDAVASAARAAKAAGVKHFSLLTAQGSRKVGLPSWMVRAIHPLLYMHTKWEAEQAVLEQGFDRVSFFRPGLLDRRVPGADERWMEKLATAVGVSSLAVRDLAVAMVRDALTDGSAAPVAYVDGNPTIRSLSEDAKL